jgi:hypothetical protein
MLEMTRKEGRKRLTTPVSDQGREERGVDKRHDGNLTGKLEI